MISPGFARSYNPTAATNQQESLRGVFSSEWSEIIAVAEANQQELNNK